MVRGDPVKHRRLGLVRGGVLLGRLTYLTGEHPTLHYMFQPTPAFAEVAPLFEDELEKLDADDLAAWQESYDHIRKPGLVLEMPNGSIYAGDFVLHIQGEKARLRL
jgi:hypothetical protein